MPYVSISTKKRVLFMLTACMGVVVILLCRLLFIQVIKSDYYSQKAYSQQTRSKSVEAKRGTIYDRNGEILAMSASSEMITINPNNIPKDKKESVARTISEILELDYEKILKKVNKNSSIEIIAKKVDKEKSNQLRKWLLDNNIETGINIDEDAKRYYPNSTLASQIIGFCGSDNQGLNGLEAKYDEVLKGKSGNISKLSDAKGRKIGETGENYTEAIEGDSIELTIDSNIQKIAEK